MSLYYLVRKQAEFGTLYGAQNVAISGIHTHSGPGGYLQYLLYDITSLGFVRESFDALVNGIVLVSCIAQNVLRIVYMKVTRLCYHVCLTVRLVVHSRCKHMHSATYARSHTAGHPEGAPLAAKWPAFTVGGRAAGCQCQPQSNSLHGELEASKFRHLTAEKKPCDG
jgi:Neutral/alkaline non-lysosomal ceramidase, N-terminal